MSFQTGLSGLSASARNLEVIGHNIANANTIGMKASRAEFAAVYASSLGATCGCGGGNAGIGVQVAAVAQLFTQGSLRTTTNQLDLAINGAGFFRVNPPGVEGTVYTRNGEFKLDRNGFIVTNSGARLQGLVPNATGALIPGDLMLPTGSPIAPLATGVTAANPLSRGIEITANLDAGAAIQPAPAAGPLTPAQKLYSTALNVFDGVGVAIPVQLYFVKTAANEWRVVASRDNGNTLLAGGGTLRFDPASGRLTLPITPALTNIAIPLATTPPTSLNIPITLTDPAGTPTLTQFGAPFGVFALSQDGSTAGTPGKVEIAENGEIRVLHSNGVTRVAGQITLANFRNVQGLQPINGGYWSQTFDSGVPIPNLPQEGGLGSVLQSTLEESNVELTQELVNMMVAQRSYQANAQTIRTQDQVLQTLVNMR